jgi:hypothetical protein
MRFFRYVILLLFCFFFQSSSAGSFDDFRYFPVFLPPVTNITEHSYTQINWFATTASWAYTNADERRSLFSLYGEFNLNNMASALPLVGIQNPLRPDLQNTSLPFFVDGVMHTQGFVINGEYVVFGDPKETYGAFSFGATILALITNAAYTFTFNRNESSLRMLTDADVAEIERTRSEIFSLLGIVGDHAGDAGFGDVSLYVRHFHTWDFTLKFRKIEAAIAFALLIPAGAQSTIQKPHLLSMGANGHWGIRICAQGVFQVKEFVKMGVEAAVSQRFSKTRTIRIPINEEAYVFGVDTGEMKISPGTTVRFSPYFVFEQLRENLSLGIEYTLIHHVKNDWIDKRAETAPKATLEFATKASAFSSEYITLFGLYEFRSPETEKEITPLVPSFQVLLDIPVSFFDTYYTPRTFRITLSAALHF